MKFPEVGRILDGPLASDPGQPSGAFYIPVKKQSKAAQTPSTLQLPAGYRPKETPPERYKLLCIASSAFGWDHVSVTIPDTHRTPTWEEMCLVKSLFWDENETVWQYHPPKDDYVNNHPFCLHLWRKHAFDMPLPMREMVGIPGVGPVTPTAGK